MKILKYFFKKLKQYNKSIIPLNFTVESNRAKKMTTLQAIKVKGETYLYLNNVLKAKIPRSQRQPRKDKKTIMLNCFKYNLEF